LYFILQSGAGYSESKAAHAKGGLGTFQSTAEASSAEDVEQDGKVLRDVCMLLLNVNSVVPILQTVQILYASGTV
jgi:hypothetical protein